MPHISEPFSRVLLLQIGNMRERHPDEFACGPLHTCSCLLLRDSQRTWRLTSPCRRLYCPGTITLCYVEHTGPLSCMRSPACARTHPPNRTLHRHLEAPLTTGRACSASVDPAAAAQAIRTMMAGSNHFQRNLAAMRLAWHLQLPSTTGGLTSHFVELGRRLLHQCPGSHAAQLQALRAMLLWPEVRDDLVALDGARVAKLLAHGKGGYVVEAVEALAPLLPATVQVRVKTNHPTGWLGLRVAVQAPLKASHTS